MTAAGTHLDIYDGKTGKDRLAEGEAILRDRGRGMQASELMEKYGVSKATLHRRINVALASRLAFTVDQWREQQGAVLDDRLARWEQQIAAALELIRIGTEKDDAALLDRGMQRHAEALNGLLRVDERRARLMGLDAPVKVEAHVTHSTPIDDAVSALVGQIEDAASTAG